MSQVKVRFFDDETLVGETELNLDEPDFLLDIYDPSGLENSEVAWIPLSAVKVVEFPPDGGHQAQSKKVAIRFLDGEVLRGHLGGEVSRHRFGISLYLHPEKPGAQDQVQRIGVPFSAIKALFYVREFDGRPEEDQGLPSDAYLAKRTMAPLLDVLEEIDMLTRLHRGGVLTDDEFKAKRTQLLEVL